MTCVAGHVLIHEGYTGNPLDQTWTGVCCDARSTSTFWYIGRNDGERSFSRLKATELKEATAEALILLRAECQCANGSIASLLASIWNTTPLDDAINGSGPWWLTAISNGVRVYTSPRNIGMRVADADVAYLFMKDGGPVKSFDDHRPGGLRQSTFAEFQSLTRLLPHSATPEPDGATPAAAIETMRG